MIGSAGQTKPTAVFLQVTIGRMPGAAFFGLRPVLGFAAATAQQAGGRDEQAAQEAEREEVWRRESPATWRRIPHTGRNSAPGRTFSEASQRIVPSIKQGAQEGGEKAWATPRERHAAGYMALYSKNFGAACPGRRARSSVDRKMLSARRRPRRWAEPLAPARASHIGYANSHGRARKPRRCGARALEERPARGADERPGLTRSAPAPPTAFHGLVKSSHLRAHVTEASRGATRPRRTGKPARRRTRRHGRCAAIRHRRGLHNTFKSLLGARTSPRPPTRAASTREGRRKSPASIFRKPASGRRRQVQRLDGGTRRSRTSMVPSIPSKRRANRSSQGEGADDSSAYKRSHANGMLSPKLRDASPAREERDVRKDEARRSVRTGSDRVHYRCGGEGRPSLGEVRPTREQAC